MNATAKSIVDSFREVVHDLLVPELEALRVEMKLRDDTTQLAIRYPLRKKPDYAIDIRERLAALEARLPRQ